MQPWPLIRKGVEALRRSEAACCLALERKYPFLTLSSIWRVRDELTNRSLRVRQRVGRVEGYVGEHQHHISRLSQVPKQWASLFKAST